MDINLLTEEYKKIYKEEPKYYFFSPGRINIIGEHIDYHAGYVLPLAISLGTHAVLKPRKDSKCLLYSEGFSNKPYELDLNNLKKEQKLKWVNYVIGMITYIKEEGYIVNKGFNIYIKGTIPAGAGLSSSASLEVLIGLIIRELNNLDISLVDIALLGKKVENKYLGLNSGIMDQFSIALGKKNSCIKLDTNSLIYEYIPFNLGEDYELVIGFTNKQRSLVDSKYNERFFETNKALKLINKTYKVKNLVDLKLEDLNKLKDKLGPLLYKRTKHIITEQERVLKVNEALINKNIKEVGRLLYEGHKSLSYDYEVSGKELDTLVKLFKDKQAIGARQTGAGFGGSMIAIVRKNKLKETLDYVLKNYKKIIGYEAKIFKAKSSMWKKKKLT